MNGIDYLSIARRVFSIEARSLNDLGEAIDANFSSCVDAILCSRGRVIVCGMGKSGIIGRKIAATFSSTGTPSFFMHPGEAYHGDLGMVKPSDIFLAISNSGETDEVVKLIPFLRNNGNYLVAMTGSERSTLAKAAHCHVLVAVREEACPLQLAPTSSTTAALVMGDALAVTLMSVRGFQPENFARFHPGGALGRRLLAKVEDEMQKAKLPRVSVNATFFSVLQAITHGSLGLAIVDDGTTIAGVITDGDIRRAMEKYGRDAMDKSASDLMTCEPIKVSIGTRIEDALALMTRSNISALLVFNKMELVGVFKK